MQAAAVLARQDGGTAKRLVAYVVSSDTPHASLVPMLRTWVRGKLPEYMMPAVFVSLPALPLTPNGKVDRKALPPPEQGRPMLDKDFVGPRSSTEEMLAEIWREVLGLDRVGVHDNFFELGGHSLMAIQVISRLREIAQVELSMHHFFDRPTIASLADIIEGILIREISQLSEQEARGLADSAQFTATR